MEVKTGAVVLAATALVAAPRGRIVPAAAAMVSYDVYIAGRYRLDASRLDHIQNNLPQPVEEEIVPPVVASAFREVVPNYTVRAVFALRITERRTPARASWGPNLA